MPNTPTPFALMPSDLPPLSDSSAVEILEFLHELVFRFEAHYYGQIHRWYQQQREPIDPATNAASADDSDPFAF
jgi:hypothetical protein